MAACEGVAGEWEADPLTVVSVPQVEGVLDSSAVLEAVGVPQGEPSEVISTEGDPQPGADPSAGVGAASTAFASCAEASAAAGTESADWLGVGLGLRPLVS